MVCLNKCKGRSESEDFEMGCGANKTCAARVTGANPSLFNKLVSEPFSTRKAAISWNPFAAATCNGELPTSSGMSFEKPTSIRNFTHGNELPTLLVEVSSSLVEKK